MPAIIYRLANGDRVPGTTTVIGQNLGWNKQPLMHWANQMGLDGKSHREVAEKAADAGTLAHAMVEADLKGKPFPEGEVDINTRDKAETAYLAWLEWKELVGFELIASELSLVSEEHKVGGTIDVAAIKRVPCILDLKTSNAIYPDHWIQCASYGHIYSENYPGKPIQAYYILQLSKETGGFSYHYRPELENEWTVFKHLLEIHRLKKVVGK